MTSSVPVRNVMPAPARRPGDRGAPSTAYGLTPTPPYQLTSAADGRGPVLSGRHSETSTTPGSTSRSPLNASSAKSSTGRAWAGTPALR